MLTRSTHISRRFCRGWYLPPSKLPADYLVCDNRNRFWAPMLLDFLDPSILSISAELRQAALIIILLKAGLSLDPADLRRVGPGRQS